MVDMAKKLQVAQQCKAIAHMAKAIGEVYEQKGQMFEAGGYGDDAMTALVGNWSAGHMEILGDILNGMDACDEADDWMEPVFREAQRLWPQPARD